MSELKERLLPAIKSRADVKSKRISVSKLLKMSGMENYFNVCCSRIIQEGDTEELEAAGIEIDMGITSGQYDVHLNSNGFLKSKRVLLGYIPEKTLEDVFISLCYEEQITMQVNSLAQMLRNIKTGELIKGFLEMAVWHKKTCQNEYLENTQRYYILELFYRSHLWQAVRKLHGAVADGYQRIKYRRIISELIKSAAA
ncbi:hypothetical protein [Anaerobutyricum hallii]|uniref:Uncharacterized protein n=1 Tax=Anaerobutyricum hallii TaxID=39488 RepID=A0A415U8S6_9FIRM|nr:hypothetical protein [Anaerobutyricum hallii]RHN14536.1 hypothetical protein DWZ29_05895 [Anaerobutyricum hallii]